MVLNNIVLNFDNTIKKGNFDSKPAKIAPAPKATNNDGNAQHIKVPTLVNKLKDGKIRVFKDISFIINCFFQFLQLYILHPQIF